MRTNNKWMIVRQEIVFVSSFSLKVKENFPHGFKTRVLTLKLWLYLSWGSLPWVFICFFRFPIKGEMFPHRFHEWVLRSQLWHLPPGPGKEQPSFCQHKEREQPAYCYLQQQQHQIKNLYVTWQFWKQISSDPTWLGNTFLLLTTTAAPNPNSIFKLKILEEETSLIIQHGQAIHFCYLQQQQHQL